MVRPWAIVEIARADKGIAIIRASVLDNFGANYSPVLPTQIIKIRYYYYYYC
jgi:hypothetical protein